MRPLRSFAVLLLALGACLVAGHQRRTLGMRLEDPALARITGLDDTSSINTSACASLSLTEGQVLWNNCPTGGAIQAGPNSPGPIVVCVKCSNESMTKIDNTSGGPGIYKVGSVAVCANKLRYTGDCDNGECVNLAQNGMCTNQNNTDPPTYDYQN